MPALLTSEHREHIVRRFLEQLEQLSSSNASAAEPGERLYQAALELQQELERSAFEFARSHVERLERGHALLAHAGELWSAPLEYETILAKLADAVVPRFADRCTVDLLDRQDALVRVGQWPPAGPRDAELDDRLREPVRRCLDGRTSAWSAEPPAVDGRSLSYLIAPLVVPDRTLGAISFVYLDGRAYDERDLWIAEGLTSRAALAIQNAELYRETTHALRTREELVAIVSHDLKTPLAAIRLSSEAIQRALGGPEPNLASLRRHADTVVRCTVKMERLVRGLLDLSRLDAGQLPIELRAERALDLVQQSYEAALPLAEQKRVTLACELPSDVVVRCDRERVLQVLANLIDNAVKFSPEGGLVGIAIDVHEGRARFSIRDSGPGISDADVVHVFERFWQAPSGGKSGSGLGLAIAKAIVQAHGGSIGVETVPGRGSTFFFTLPLDDRDRAPSSTPSPAS